MLYAQLRHQNSPACVSPSHTPDYRSNLVMTFIVDPIVSTNDLELGHTIVAIISRNCPIPINEISLEDQLRWQSSQGLEFRTHQSDKTTNFLSLWMGGYGRVLSGTSSTMFWRMRMGNRVGRRSFQRSNVAGPWISRRGREQTVEIGWDFVIQVFRLVL